MYGTWHVTGCTHHSLWGWVLSVHCSDSGFHIHRACTCSSTFYIIISLIWGWQQTVTVCSLLALSIVWCYYYAVTVVVQRQGRHMHIRRLLCNYNIVISIASTLINSRYYLSHYRGSFIIKFQEPTNPMNWQLNLNTDIKLSLISCGLNILDHEVKSP